MLNLPDDTVTCSAASFALAVEKLFDETLNDWSQRRNASGKNGTPFGRA